MNFRNEDLRSFRSTSITRRNEVIYKPSQLSQTAEEYFTIHYAINSKFTFRQLNFEGFYSALVLSLVVRDILRSEKVKPTVWYLDPCEVESIHAAVLLIIWPSRGGDDILSKSIRYPFSYHQFDPFH